MLTTHLTSYMPALKWRMGAYQALTKLDDNIKDSLLPLLELPDDEQDFETEEETKTLREKLEPFGKRLAAKWGSRPCLVDTCISEDKVIEDTGQHHLCFAFELAREHKTHAIPVVSLTRSTAYLKAIQEIAKMDGRGAAIRVQLKPSEAVSTSQIDATLMKIQLGAGDCHLVLDARSVELMGAQELANHWVQVLTGPLSKRPWKSTTILASAFPGSLPSKSFRPKNFAPRTEWMAYQLLIASLQASGRMLLPRFGDYTVTHPDMAKINVRVLDPNAKIKYTVDNSWYVAVGTPLRANGREQLRPMCQSLVKEGPTIYKGPGYSYGDKYINECAQHGGSTGGASTFNTVAYNHHITHAVHQLSKMNGASGSL